MQEAFRWYESQRPGLGLAFRHAVDIAVAAIEANPEAYTTVHRQTRRVLLPSSPTHCATGCSPRIFWSSAAFMRSAIHARGALEGRANKCMELTKPDDLGGSWHVSLRISESGFAAHARCWAPHGSNEEGNT